MNAIATHNWHEANQRYLTAALAVVRQALERHAKRVEDHAEQDAPHHPHANAAHQAVAHMAERLPAPAALDTLGAAFALSPFERDMLLLCAGVELDGSFAALCAAAHGDARRSYPTFALGLAALPGAHWSALTPVAPLRRWRLIDVGGGDNITTSPLRIDERVLHHLTGVVYLDERLRGLMEPLHAPVELPPSHAEPARRITELYSTVGQGTPWPLIQLCGDEAAAKHAIAAAACAALGVQLHAMRATDIPLAVAEREVLARLWEREAALSGSALLVDCDDCDSPDAKRALLAFLEGVQSMLLMTSREPLRTRTRLAIRLDVNKPSAAEQQALWRTALGPVAHRLDGQVEGVVAQFHLGLQGIQAVGAEVRSRYLDEGPKSGDRPLPASMAGVPWAQLFWEACRVQARPRLDELAQRVEAVAVWDDLILPEPQCQLLRGIVAHVRQRARVYETWGFALKGARGLGISALFAGASGTGKTMAAEVLANELHLDLYRIDLSQVVSKYVGETEKNLRRVFDAAEEGGAILLFDEADALFGKRSEVKDSHDRYANIEISYLLQRMEAYRGLAILTTNMKQALDQAFLRRIRFVVQFPFPDAAQRCEIWRRVFPAATPTAGLVAEKLARLNVAGGNIRNIALHAAFLAAEAAEPVRMMHLLQAARTEYAKLEKPLTEAECGDWG